MSYFSSTWLLDSYVIFGLLVWAHVLNFMNSEWKWWTIIEIFLVELTVKEIHHIVSFIRSAAALKQFKSKSFIDIRILFCA